MSPHLGEHRIWLADRSRRRLLIRDHDALYVALWRFRMRLMKPAWMHRWPR